MDNLYFVFEYYHNALCANHLTFAQSKHIATLTHTMLRAQPTSSYRTNDSRSMFSLLS